MSIVIKNICKTFGNFVALDDITFEVADGTLVALLGPSGSGKTTLLRIIAGLEVADSGTVLRHEEDITHHSARDRKVGFVFQHYALFRHMTVAQNIGYGLRVRKTPKAQIRERVAELLKLIRLERLHARYPGQLSGGQRQRVALARALAAQPEVLLLDEPFGALDAKVRKDLRKWLRRLHEKIHVTSIFVTHDQEEALELADQVVLMREGRIEQIGSPRDIYDRPATPFVYEFLGSANRLPCHVQAGRIDVAGGWFEPPYGIAIADGPACLFVRPHDLAVERAGRRTQGMLAVLTSVMTTGPTYRLQLKLVQGDADVEAEMAKSRFDALGLAPGASVMLRPVEFGLFPAPESDPVVAVPTLQTLGSHRHQAAVA